MTTSFFSGLADQFAKGAAPVDPVEWAWNKAGIDLWSKQREIMQSVQKNKKTASQSCHGSGKSLLASVIAAWWVDTHPPDDVYVISTAPSKDQVSGILWENIRKIHDDADLMGRVTLDDKWRMPVGRRQALVGQGRKPADYSQSVFQGIHRKYVLFILDESCGIPQWIWNAAIANTDTDECRVLAIGNPDDPTSEFARVCKRDASWNVIKISVWDCPNFTDEEVSQAVREHTVQKSYVEDARYAWGETSPLWRSKIEGEFPDSNESSVIPYEWVMKAHERFDMFMDMPPTPAGSAPYKPKIFGVDVARFGVDKTIICVREGNVLTQFIELQGKDTIQIYERINKLARRGVDRVIVDMGGGHGSGVFDMLKRRGHRVFEFSPGAKTDKTDETKKLKFTRVRSAAWWKFRDALDPNKESILAFGKQFDKHGIDLLSGDLTNPEWTVMLGDQIQVESKEEVKKKIGRSTDYADAAIMAWWLAPDDYLNDTDESVFNYTDSGIDDTFSYEEDFDIEELSYEH